MKKCPFCAEEIQNDAVVCRYCGRELSGAAVRAVPVVVTQPRRRNTCLSILVTLGAITVCGSCLIAFLAGDLPDFQQTSPARAPTADGTATESDLPATEKPTERAHTSTPGPSSTPANTLAPSATPPPSQSPTPNWAGASEWLESGGRIVGVREVWWGRSLGLYGADRDKTFVSLYILARNLTGAEWTFFDSEFRLIDGGGEIHAALILPEKEPAFGSCRIQHGGTCEGWWTAQIFEREEVMANLVLRWRTGLFSADLETDVEP